MFLRVMFRRVLGEPIFLFLLIIIYVRACYSRVLNCVISGESSPFRGVLHAAAMPEIKPASNRAQQARGSHPNYNLAESLVRDSEVQNDRRKNGDSEYLHVLALVATLAPDRADVSILVTVVA